MAGNERDFGWDGGWEDLAEDGHDFAEEILLGPVHPYDRNDHYVPPRGWESRHELVSRRFEDPIEELEAGRTPHTRRAPQGRGVVRRAGGGRPSSSPAPDPKPVDRKSANPSPPRTKADRAKAVAARLGISVEELTRLRRSLAAAQTATSAIRKGDRDAAIVRHMGIPLATLAALRAAELRFGAPRPLRRRTRSRRAYPSQSLRSPPAPICRSCGHSISPSGHCGC